MTVADMVSSGEFERTMTGLRDEMREGFRGLNARLDALNGQTRRHGETLARHDERIESLEEAPASAGIAPSGKALAGGVTVLLSVGAAVWEFAHQYFARK